MADKLTTINNALILTGNNPVNVEDEADDGWRVGSVAYDTGLKEILTRAPWTFATKIQTVARVGASPDARWADAFVRPPECLLLRAVQVGGYNSSDYRVIDNQICTNARGLAVALEYVREPAEETWFSLFTRTLQLLVEAGIYQGLNEDGGRADGKRSEAEMMLREARTASDQQSPRRAVFVSRVAARRRGWCGPALPR